MKMDRFCFSTLASIALLFAACSRDPNGIIPQSGAWGGQNIRFKVSSDGKRIEQIKATMAANISIASYYLPISNSKFRDDEFQGTFSSETECAGTATYYDLFSDTVKASIQWTAAPVPPGTDANLRSIYVDSGTLRPAFNPSILNYYDTVGTAVDSLWIYLTLSDDFSTLTVNGRQWSIFTSHYALSMGENNFRIEVTAEDGITRKTYTLAVIRRTS